MDFESKKQRFMQSMQARGFDPNDPRIQGFVESRRTSEPAVGTGVSGGTGLNASNRTEDSESIDTGISIGSATAGEREQQRALNSLRADVAQGAVFKDVAKRYGEVLPSYLIRDEYDAGSRYGPAKESESQFQSFFKDSQENEDTKFVKELYLPLINDSVFAGENAATSPSQAVLDVVDVLTNDYKVDVTPEMKKLFLEEAKRMFEEKKKGVEVNNQEPSKNSPDIFSQFFGKLNPKGDLFNKFIGLNPVQNPNPFSGIFK